MPDPDAKEEEKKKKEIDDLKKKADKYKACSDGTEQKLQTYQKDYDNYIEKLLVLDFANKSTTTAVGELNDAKNQLKKYSSGNKSSNAMGLMFAIIGLVSSISSSGIEAIKIYIMNDMEKIVKEYADTHKRYTDYIITYNDCVSKLRNRGVNSYFKRPINITKSSLV